MNYHVASQGQQRGVFSLTQLAEKRREGSLTGQELVWCEGMPNWDTLDEVLALPPRSAPPPSARWPRITALAAACVVLIAIVAVSIYSARALRQASHSGISLPGLLPKFSPVPTGATEVEPASRPIAYGTNTLTATDVAKQRVALNMRQFLEAYDHNGPHDQPWDNDAKVLIRSFAKTDATENTNLQELRDLADKLAADPACNDPMVLLVAGFYCPELYEATHRYERAVEAFADSKYPPYAKLFACWRLDRNLKNQVARQQSLERSALDFFRETLRNGSLRPEEQPLLADSLLTESGSVFFKNNEERVVAIANEAGPDFHWLMLVLKGQHEINEAWKGRGNGWADTVTSGGWDSFGNHLSRARASLTEAWKLHPDWPQAPASMITVAMGETDGAADEVRKWFDCATMAQIDYAPAWNNMRWALRPRWGGSLEAMKALGISAINSGRFDTIVPRQFFDSVTDLVAEENLRAYGPLYGEADIWPQLKRMYEGYIAHLDSGEAARGWRETYTVVAYLAAHFDTCREQLEKLDWRLDPSKVGSWGVDLSLLPLEVAARTGGNSGGIAAAEETRAAGHIMEALGLYQKLAAQTNDVRTRQFIRYRLASLEVETKMKQGEWVEFLPKNTNDLNWSAPRGQWSVSPDGSVEIESGPLGSLLVSQVRVGANFEIKGEFEVVRSTTRDFQAGIVMGYPQPDGSDWFSFRMKRNAHEKEVAAYAKGWTLNGSTIKPCLLNDVTNSFDFQLADGKATATVNNHGVFTQLANPGNIWIANSQYVLGLGAYNDMNETVIRYRNVKVRRL